MEDLPSELRRVIFGMCPLAVQLVLECASKAFRAEVALCVETVSTGIRNMPTSLITRHSSASSLIVRTQADCPDWLPAVRSLTALTAFELNRFETKSTDFVSAISGLTKLQQIRLNNLSPTKINGFDHLIPAQSAAGALTSLSVQNIIMTVNDPNYASIFREIPVFANLRTLSLAKIGSLIPLDLAELLRNAVQLKELTLQDLAGISPFWVHSEQLFGVLGGYCSALTKLSLISLNCGKLTAIGSIPTLRSLELHKTEVSSTAGLMALCHSLESLNLEEAFNPSYSDDWTISYFSRLTHLSLAGCYQFQSIEWISYLPQLLSLDLRFLELEASELTDLYYLTSLTRLNCGSMYNLSSKAISILCELPSLTSLNLRGSDLIRMTPNALALLEHIPFLYYNDDQKQ